MPHRVIHLHVQAPPKPPAGAACNGCGVCCAVGPCPLGLVQGRRWRGPCPLLRWEDGARRYRCGALDGPLPRRWVARWIGAGRGCDCTLQVG